MLKGGKLPAVLACAWIGALVAFTQIPVPWVGAQPAQPGQPPQVLQSGLYTMAKRLKPFSPRQCDNPDCWEETAMDPALPKQLFITSLAATSPVSKLVRYNGPIYVYGTRWGQYRTSWDYMLDNRTQAETIELCGFWSGYVRPKTMHLVPTATSGEQQYYVLDYEVADSKKTQPTFPNPAFFKACEGTAPRTSLLADRAPSPQLFAFQPSGGRQKGVDGEVLLALPRAVLQNPGAAPEEAEMWACVVTTGYPGLELVERSSGQKQNIYVWPDGTFQALVVRNATYRWRLRSRNCGIASMPSYVTKNQFTVPDRSTPADEKLVFACYVSKRTFSECDQWWLTRP